jgi:hypothetical protein
MATKTKKRKCSCCGGHCGGTSKANCKHAANDAKRRGDELWAYLTGRPAALATQGEK